MAGATEARVVQEGELGIAGKWVCVRRFKVGDVVRVEIEFASSHSSGEATLQSGWRGIVRMCDEDGDAIINFPHLEGHGMVADRIISARQRHNIKVMRTDEDAGSEPSTQGSDSDGDDAGASDEEKEMGHATFFDRLYKQPGLFLPWDIRQPQPDFVALHKRRPECFASPVLDVGAGFGDHTVWLSLSLGLETVACDISVEALAEAQRRFEQAAAKCEGAARQAVPRFVASNFLKEPRHDALVVEGSFQTVLDSAVFHCIGDEEAQQQYVKAVTELVRPAGYLIMLAFSDRNPPQNDDRLRPVSKEQLNGYFRRETGWEVEDICEGRYCLVQPRIEGSEAPQARISTPAWFMVARRLGVSSEPR